MKDELLLSLLASQAVVDSKDSEILNADEVEELKRVRGWLIGALLFFSVLVLVARGSHFADTQSLFFFGSTIPPDDVQFLG